MIKVIPAIIAKDIDEIAKKMSLVEPYVDWVQIDVSDGIFTSNVTWNRPEELKNIVSNISLEMHLMIANSAKDINGWIASGAKRIIVHVDDKSNQEEVAAMAKKAKDGGVSFGIALSPEVLVNDIKSLVPLADVVLLLAVNPGFSGQEFNESTLEKITDLRKIFPNVIIEIDGGINPETAKKCVAAGANILVSASYIFDSPNIKEAIDSLT
jgi:ribulose-phosphate 3-epimerase